MSLCRILKRTLGSSSSRVSSLRALGPRNGVRYLANQPIRPQLHPQQQRLKPSQMPQTITTELEPPAPLPPDLEELRKRDPMERLRDPTLRFDDEDDVPSEYNVVMQELDNEFENIFDEYDEARKDPDWILYDRTVRARIAKLEFEWMADPSPVTGESRLELEAKIADVIDATKEEMFEYFAEREEMTAAQRAKREGKYHDEVKEVGSLMAAQMGEEVDELYQHYGEMDMYRNETDESPQAGVDRILAHKHMENRRAEKALAGGSEEEMVKQFINEDFGDMFHDMVMANAPESVKTRILARKKLADAEEQAKKDQTLKKQVNKIIKKKSK